MKFTDKVYSLIEQEKELATKAIDKIKSLGYDFPVVYLPNFMPEQEVDYIFVAMEPSFGRWGTVEKAEKLISQGFKNFIFSKGDYLLHFAINKYLTSSYHITDVSKLAMEIDSADSVREEMYNFWRYHLIQEIETLKSEKVEIISIGGKPKVELIKILPNQQIHEIIHFSGAAQKARNDFSEKYQDEFESFVNAFNKEEVHYFSEELLKARIVNFEVKSFIQKYSYKGLGNIRESDLKLLFNYKSKFETIN